MTNVNMEVKHGIDKDVRDDWRRSGSFQTRLSHNMKYNRRIVAFTLPDLTPLCLKCYNTTQP
jgi:hypothetical protein